MSTATLPAAPTMGSPPGPVLSLDAVHLGYGGRTVLADVSFTVAGGEFWFLLGPNGAGKSTLLRSVLGGLPPQSGTVQRRADLLRPDCIGFVPQRCDLNPGLPTTIREFVSLGLVGVPGARRQFHERLAWALERAGLSGMERRDYWSLSGGQRQRALLARALIRRPSLFIVDEPTTGLDPRSQDRLMSALAELNREERLTILFVTHDLPLAARYASHIALFIEGTVRAGTRAQTLTPDLMRRAYGLPIEMHAESPNAGAASAEGPG